jgi:hypothetical protein
MLSVIMLSVIMPSVIMLRVAIFLLSCWMSLCWVSWRPAQHTHYGVHDKAFNDTHVDTLVKNFIGLATGANLIFQASIQKCFSTFMKYSKDIRERRNKTVVNGTNFWRLNCRMDENYNKI